jgi:hypothetical protein
MFSSFLSLLQPDVNCGMNWYTVLALSGVYCLYSWCILWYAFVIYSFYVYAC